MRIVSNDFSRRLCAFSVFSARILNAIVGVRHEQRDDGAMPEFFQRLQPVVAVRRPVAFVSVSTNDDDGIEEDAHLFDHAHQAFDVRVRRIALIGRGRNPIDGQRHQEQRLPAHRIEIAREHRALALLDDAGKRVEVGRGDGGLRCRKALRKSRDFLATGSRFSRRQAPLPYPRLALDSRQLIGFG